MQSPLRAAGLLALLALAAPAPAQQLVDLVPPAVPPPSPLTVSPFDPALEGIILDTVVPLAPAGRLDALQPGQQPALGLPTFMPVSGSGLDHRTNSAFRWSQRPDGAVGVRGTNLRTGSLWYGTIRPSGLMSGFDGDLNFWRYDLRTGIYTNTTTGETCIPQGPAGACGP